MSIHSFEVAIDSFVNVSKEKMLDVIKQSVQEIVVDAQTPIAEGGKMPVDTGFLRWSGAASINHIPSGLTEGRKRSEGEVGVLPEYARDKEASYISDLLIKLKIGDTFYFGWTAIYAEKQETYNLFMTSAVKNWKQIVEKNVRRVRKND